MTRFTLPIASLAALLISAFSAGSAHAQTRVFVAAQGSDSNPCTFAAPCRTFQHAHNVVAAEGEIDVLDPAGYGALTITKAISIQGHGFSGVSVTGVVGIAINGSATDVVNLNGLLIEGNAVGLNCILFNSGKSLVIENCVVRNLAGSGLGFSSSAATLQTLSVSNSYFTSNGGSGISIVTLGSGAITAAITQAAFYGNSVGVVVNGGNGTGALNVAVTDSVAGNNVGAPGIGFVVQSSAAQSISSLVLTRATSVGNGRGVEASGANATLRLAQSTVTGNTTGYDAASPGIILSYGDNYIDANGSNTGVLGSAIKQ